MNFYYFKAMVLNIIWLIFFFGAFVACMVQWLAFGDSGIFTWSPLGRGRIKENPFIVKMAEKYMVTPEKLMLRFLNQQDISIIPKSNNEERMKANLDIYDFTIDEFDMSLLLSLPQLGFSEEHPDL